MTLDKRITRLEEKRRERSASAQDRHGHRNLIIVRRASGECPRFNRVQQLRAERLAAADAHYCRILLERYDRKDANKWVRRGSHGHSMTLFNLLRGSSRQPVIERLCQLHGLDTSMAEQIIERAKQSGRIELTEEIICLLKAAPSRSTSPISR